MNFKTTRERSQATERKDDVEARNDFWSMEGDFIHRHHVEPRVQLHGPKEETFPNPLKYIDVTRTAHTELDVLQERAALTTIGMQMWIEICQTHGKDSRSSHY